jgi:hypothetical protein
MIERRGDIGDSKLKVMNSRECKVAGKMKRCSDHPRKNRGEQKDHIPVSTSPPLCGESKGGCQSHEKKEQKSHC